MKHCRIADIVEDFIQVQKYIVYIFKASVHNLKAIVMVHLFNGSVLILMTRMTLETVSILDWTCEMEPSNAFLKFAEDWLSKNHADRNHNPSFRDCMLSIPGSLSSASVKDINVVQEWNGIRPKIDNRVFEDFRYYLIGLKVDMSRKGIGPPASSCDFCDAEISYILDKAGYTRHRLCNKCIVGQDISAYQVNLAAKKIPS